MTSPPRMAILSMEKNKQDNDYAALRYDWTSQQIDEIYNLPFPRLIHYAQKVHTQTFRDDEIQLCTLLSVKTGGCKEDCSYCPQSAHYKTDLKAEPFMDLDKILSAAKKAKEGGASRFCMGAAWTSPPKKGPQFGRVLEAVSEVSKMGLEVCTTLGMLDKEEAKALKEAGVYAYNHNIDTSREYYDKIITTRTYQDRLDTLKNVRQAGMTVCCGGIVGLGEARHDRIEMIKELASLSPHPESVPINLLVKVEGTPLGENEDIDIFDMVRTIATARIVMPKSRVRLSAGREGMSDEAQALCYLAGANSIFTGDKLLTTKNPGDERDQALFQKLGLKPEREAVSAP